MLTGEKGQGCVATPQTLIPILPASSRANFGKNKKTKISFSLKEKKEYKIEYGSALQKTINFGVFAKSFVSVQSSKEDENQAS